MSIAVSAVHLPACRDCLYWREATVGQGLNPVDRLDQVQDWWRQAGYCMRHAPSPTGEPGCRGFWRATHATDRCAEGRVIPATDSVT